MGNGFIQVPYKKLSKEEEMRFIKKLKLSYYDFVDDDTKQLYLSYYEEMFPHFKEYYENAEGKQKERLLRGAIENSSFYRDQFLINNIRFIAFVLKEYYPDLQPVEDMYQEGIIGMMKGLEKFDISVGTRFLTYAVWWIRQSINQYLSRCGFIYLPYSIRSSLKEIDSVEEKLSIDLKRIPTKKELAEEFNISLKDLEQLFLLRSQREPDSLAFPVMKENDENMEKLSLIIDDSISFTDTIENQILFEQLKPIIDSSDLNDKEKMVLYLRFGFNCDDNRTLYEVGKIMGHSKQSIQQIEMKALKKIQLKLILNHSSFKSLPSVQWYHTEDSHKEKAKVL